MVMLTTFELDEYVFEALRHGASGFLLKDAEPADLLDAIRIVADGGSLLAPSVTRTVIEHFGSRPATKPHPRIDELTEREREIIGWVATGRSNAEIAEELVVSPDTVRTHVSRAMVKLRCARPGATGRLGYRVRPFVLTRSARRVARAARRGRVEPPSVSARRWARMPHGVADTRDAARALRRGRADADRGLPVVPAGVALRSQAKPGTVELGRWIVRKYGGGFGGILRRCHGGGTSEHNEGRAFDWTVSVSIRADRERVRAFLDDLFATDRSGNEHARARRMGVMYVIWNDHMYSAWDRYEAEPYKSSSCRRIRTCSATLRHRDHVHISLTRKAARAETSWFVRRR